MGSARSTLEIRADTSQVRSMGSTLKAALGMGKTSARELKAETQQLHKTLKDLVLQQRGLNIQLKGVREGTAEYKRLETQLNAVRKAMKGVSSDLNIAKQAKEEMDRPGAERMEKLQRFMARQAMVQTMTSGLMQAAGSGAGQPFAAGAGYANMLGGIMGHIPIAGVPLAFMAANLGAGLQSKQSWTNRYLQYDAARFGAAPHIRGFRPEAALGYGYGPEEAMGLLRGFGGAVGGAFRPGLGMLDLSARGFGAGVAGIGRLTSFGGGLHESVRGQYGGMRSSESREQFTRGFIDAVTDLVVGQEPGQNPTAGRVEEYLQRMTGYLQGMADEGIDIDPHGFARLMGSYYTSSLGLVGKAGIRSQSMAGGRGLALHQAVDRGSKGGTGAAGAAAYFAALDMGLSGPEAMAAAARGVGTAPGQVSPQAFYRRYQAFMGRGGDSFGWMDVAAMKDLGVTPEAAAYARRVDPGQLGLAGKSHGGVRALARAKRDTIAMTQDVRELREGERILKDPGQRDAYIKIQESIFELQKTQAASVDGHWESLIGLVETTNGLLGAALDLFTGGKKVSPYVEDMKRQIQALGRKSPAPKRPGKK